MVVATIAYYCDYFDKHTHPQSLLRATALWNNDIPFSKKVVVRYPWDATEDTPQITGLPPDVVLLAEIETMKRDMAELKAELKASFELTLVDQLNMRDVGGSGFARGNEIVSKLEKLETLIEKVSEASSASQAATPSVPALPPHNDEPAVNVLDNKEEDVILALRDAHSTVATRAVQRRTQKQLSNRTVKVGFHHGHFNLLSLMWVYPKGLTVIQLARLWLIGSEKEHVPSLRRLSAALVAHFDPRGRIKSRMKFVMREVEYLARLKGVWHEG